MFHDVKFTTVNLSKRNYWLVICIAKNLVWRAWKMIFSIFRFFCTLRFQIFKHCPNHTSIESSFIQRSDAIKKMDLHDWFCGRVALRAALIEHMASKVTGKQTRWPFQYFSQTHINRGDEVRSDSKGPERVIGWMRGDGGKLDTGGPLLREHCKCQM